MEEENPSKIQQFLHQNAIGVIVFLVIQIIIVILLVTIISNINNNSFEAPSTKIFNLTQKVNDLPTDSVEPIQVSLYDAVEINKGTLQSITDSDAEVRDGSVVNLYFEKQNVHYVSFIVDIPSISQSYQVFHEWSDEANNPYIMLNMATMTMCLPQSMSIYEDFKCHDRFAQNGQRIIVSTFIKYFNFDGFTAFVKEKENNVININPISTDISKAVKDSYIQQVKESVKSLAIPSELFEYYVMQQKDYTYIFE